MKYNKYIRYLKTLKVLAILLDAYRCVCREICSIKERYMKTVLKLMVLVAFCVALVGGADSAIMHAANPESSLQAVALVTNSASPNSSYYNPGDPGGGACPPAGSTNVSTANSQIIMTYCQNGYDIEVVKQWVNYTYSGQNRVCERTIQNYYLRHNC
jgi:hypothetical protein